MAISDGKAECKTAAVRESCPRSSVVNVLCDSDEPVNLCCQNEIRLRQPIHRVRPGCDLDLAPSQQNVGMMALLLGQCANSIHKGEGRQEIGELVGAHEVMFLDDVPPPRFFQLLMNLRKFLSLQRWDTAAAGDAFLVCKHRPPRAVLDAGQVRATQQKRKNQKRKNSIAGRWSASA